MRLTEAAVYTQKCNQLFTAIVAPEHEPTNMAAGEYVMSPKSPSLLSLWICQGCLSSFSDPGVFLADPSPPKQ